MNLVTRLEARVASAAPITGRIEDVNNDFGDANVIGQAFAARGLDVAGSGRADDATNFLLKQQCARRLLPARVHPGQGRGATSAATTAPPAASPTRTRPRS